MKRLFVSAFQSRIFNDVMVGRLAMLDRLLDGDLAMKTDTEGVFVVRDAATEQARADRFEISPTGPVPGYRSSLAEGQPGLIERQAIAAHGISLEDFRRVGVLKVKGTRRPLRFALNQPRIEAGRDTRGEFLELEFAASSGCYATVVLGEIMKPRSPSSEQIAQD